MPHGEWPKKYDTDWLWYSGQLGSDGVSGPLNQRWWWEECDTREYPIRPDFNALATERKSSSTQDHVEPKVG